MSSEGIEHRREEAENGVEEFHVQKFWINTKRGFDSNSWCSNILCVCIVECDAHECLILSVTQLLFMLCVYDFLLNV
jgi:hypothetical protein